MPRARRVSAPPRVFWTHPAVSASRSLHASTALQQATTSPLAQPSVDTTRIDGFQTSNRPSRKCAPNVQIIPVTSGDGNSQNCSATYSKSGVDSLTRYRAETNAETVVLNNVARATPPVQTILNIVTSCVDCLFPPFCRAPFQFLTNRVDRVGRTRGCLKIGPQVGAQHAINLQFETLLTSGPCVVRFR